MSARSADAAPRAAADELARRLRLFVARAGLPVISPVDAFGGVLITALHGASAAVAEWRPSSELYLDPRIGRDLIAVTDAMDHALYSMLKGAGWELDPAGDVAFGGIRVAAAPSTPR